MQNKAGVGGYAGELDGELTSVHEPPAFGRTPRVFGRHTLKSFLDFFLGQAALQAIAVLTGLLLVRRLSVEAYAQFGLATSFQSVVAVLMDLGLASTIIALVGDQKDNHVLVGRYVRAARHLRNRAFWIIAPIATIVFVALMRRHHWHWQVEVLLLASVLLALYSGGKVSYTSAPLIMQGRLRDYYVPQISSSISRLVLYLGFQLMGGLSAWSAAALSALNVAVNGQLLENKSRPFLQWPIADDPKTDREVLRYVSPVIPAMVFSAFQSQISLFLISIFGGTSEIAQVAALSKISQLFAVLMMFNVILVEPRIARLPQGKLLRNFLGVLLLALAACVPVVVLAFAFPQPLLWLLGSKYAALRGDIGWLVLSSCISYVAGLLWIMNRSRKWLFWSGTALEIGLVLATQALFVSFVGVKTVREAVLFMLASSICYLVSHGYVSIYGFIRGR